MVMKKPAPVGPSGVILRSKRRYPNLGRKTMAFYVTLSIGIKLIVLPEIIACGYHLKVRRDMQPGY